MSQEFHDDYTPKVSVRLNRLEHPCEVLVTVIGDADDVDPEYFDKLRMADEAVGFVLDPVNHPHDVFIEDDTHAYSGEFFKLSACTGAFSAAMPEPLVELMFPAGRTEVTLPCKARSGDNELSFHLPEGRSLLSLFLGWPRLSRSTSGFRIDASTCMNQVTA